MQSGFRAAPADDPPVRRLLPLLLALLPLAAPGAAHAEPDRLVARFDFEETNDAGVKLGSGLTLPRSWAPIGRDPGTGDTGFAAVPYHRELVNRPGHPAYNPVGYAPDPTGGADAYLLRLGVRGGDVGAYLIEGAAPAEPGGVYRVSLKLRRRGLTHAMPRVTGCLLDGRGRRIPGTEATGTPGTAPDADGWERWSLPLGEAEGGPESVSSIGLEVAVRQPRPDPLDPLGDQRVLPVQTSGALEVDDVEVRRLPVAELTTGAALQVVRLPDRPELRLRVRDLDGGGLRARLSVEGLDGRRVDAGELPAGSGAAGGEVRWRPRLPRLGWYRARAEVLDPSGEVLLERRLDFVHGSAEEETRVGNTLLDLTDLDLPPAELVGVAAAARFPGVLLAGWTPGLTPGGVQERARELGAAARELTTRGLKLEVALGPVPLRLAAAAPRPGPALAGPPGVWMPWVEPLAVEVGGRADAWWVATPAAAACRERVADPPPALLRVASDWSAGSAVRPLAAADRRPDGPAAGAVRVLIPGAGAVESDAASPGRVALRVPSGPAGGRRRAVEELADAVLGARLARPGDGLSVGPLVRLAGGQLQPDPLLPAAERLCAWAADAAGWRPWDAAPGLECWVAPGGVLIARARGAEEAGLPLGDTPAAVAVDLWGNRWRPAPGSAPDASGVRTLQVGRLPVRVEGLDPEELTLRSSFAVDRPALEAAPGPHPRTVGFTNPHASAIRGELQLQPPAGWTVRPSRIPFRLAPGATASLRVDLGFPANAAAGDHRLEGQVVYDLRGPRSLPVQAPVSLGLPGLRLQAAVTADGPGGGDLLATCVAFNDGPEAESLSVFAQAAGQPFRERLAPRVEPGGVTVFRFRFPGAAAGGAPVPVLAGVRRSGRPGSVNAHLLFDGTEP